MDSFDTFLNFVWHKVFRRGFLIGGGLTALLLILLVGEFPFWMLAVAIVASGAAVGSALRWYLKP